MSNQSLTIGNYRGGSGYIMKRISPLDCYSKVGMFQLIDGFLTILRSNTRSDI